MARKRKSHYNTIFQRFASRMAHLSGRAITFLGAVCLVGLWAITGPLFGFSDTWQLIINTSTTIITFLMVFLIQHTQNRDTYAMQLKLDELIRVSNGAHAVLLDFEELDEDELMEIKKKYEAIAREGRRRLKEGKSDTKLQKVVLNR